ncbi:precorrin-3B synthase [Tritonibacter mobilis]|uniref:precorrin-3B synthase n=1 Tax=Tritonibacter mobilis TaxID=379347 RepID=UPI001CD98D2F|nr:precorrin-3B synthase [Tritonibacter mobilis]MCA2006315.1 precorrin-3B synthase [Tritonibacter mobilis]
MSTAPKIYGWCPGALRPMMSGDGLVVRIRAPLGRLTSEQAKAVADLSTRYGNGILDLSARANLQLRGVREASHSALIAALQDLGLVEQDAHAEARRNILMTPFWAEGDRSHHIALALTEGLAQAEDLALPGKFGFAVDAGPAPVLQGTAADIRIEGAGDRLTLRADGADVALEVCKDDAAAEALTLARWFLDQGGASEGRGRMHALLARRAAPASHTAGVARGAYRPAPGQTHSGALVALEFGQISAETFATLADLGPLRLTPWRMLLIENAQRIAPLPGLILGATDPRLRVSACTGAPGCLQALSETRALARDLAPHLPEGTSLHVSGCAKGCAHPKPADVTLTATGTDRFDLIRNGRANDRPLRSDLSARTLRAAPHLLTKDT